MGRYRIVARLGAGGMGRVYLGRSASGRAVAVKVVRPELAEDPGFRRRFAREVEAARRVNGFFTATLVDADPDGSPPWLATAYVPGMSLEEAVRVHGTWPHRSVLALGAGLAEALEAIHGAGVIHRDLKPSNVLLAADGPRVIDFGISLAAEASALTQTGTVVGTPGFMSPEQVTGKPVGPPSDVFALGAVLAFAATGAGPFGTGSAHAVNFRAVYESPDLEQLPPGLRAAVGSCLAKKPGHRPAVAALLDQLAEAAGVGGDADVTAVLADMVWLPAPVATTVRLRSAQPQSPTPLLAPLPPPTGPTPSMTAEGPRPEPPIEVRPSVPWISRRRALTALVGATAAAGLGLTGWRIYDFLGLPEPEQRWKVKLPESGTPSAPAVADGVVYVSSNDTLYALDAATGNQNWKKSTEIGSRGGDPAVADGNLYLCFDDYLHAIDTVTGEEKWKFATAENQWAVPAAAGGVVFVSGKDMSVYALDAATGAEKWKSRHAAAKEAERASLAVAGGVVYAGISDGYLAALDASTGEEKWRFRTGEPGRMYPAFAEDVVYVGSSYGNMWALDAATGGEKWKLASNNGVEALAVVSGVVYAGPYDLYALDAATGKEKWKWTSEDEFVDSPLSVTGDVVCFSTSEDRFHALDTATGKGRWRFETAAKDRSPSFAAHDGVVYISDSDGTVHAVTA
ncbi:serine/threonine-protein kinase [Streptomyces sp. NPDC041003]|uniref:serine/threonine-protein kinase n=1 Tax=Streptomyces sp. NPDC041003 TaxID=3155730 RepID=UPI0033F5CCA8